MSARYNICLCPDSRETYEVLRWLDEEWDYVVRKFGATSDATNDESMLEHGLSDDGWWLRQVLQYVDRARAFGLDTLTGRQAVAKACATMIACAAAVVRVHGELPRGGAPSGEVTPR